METPTLHELAQFPHTTGLGPLVVHLMPTSVTELTKTKAAHLLTTTHTIPSFPPVAVWHQQPMTTACQHPSLKAVVHMTSTSPTDTPDQVLQQAT